MKKIYYFLLAALPIITICSCGDDDESIVVVPSSVSMHYEDTQQLTAEGATQWTTENDFVATVDQNGLVTGGHVGTTRIIAHSGKETASATITITPKYTLYDTPLLDFGASKSVIKNKETHTLDSETDQYLYYTYTKNGHTCIVGYSFTDGKLSMVLVMLNYSDYALTGLYLLERYQPVYAQDDTYGFINSMTPEKADLLVYFSTYKSGSTTVTSVGYMPYSRESDVKGQIQKMPQPARVPMMILQ